MNNIMEFNGFTDEVLKAMKFRYPESDVNVRRVTKNNGVIYTGITVSDDKETVFPTLYLEPFYDEFNGELSEAALDKICRIYDSRRLGNAISFDYLKSYEDIAADLRCRLVNYKSNEDMLKEVPHRRFMDLAIVPYYLFKDTGLNRLIKGDATFTVRRSHLDMWNIGEDELLDTAVKNTLEKEEISIVGIFEMLKQLNPALPYIEEDCMEDCPMYVMTTAGNNGAIAMLNEERLKGFCETIGSDVYIIPSSINEVILVPAREEMPAYMINEMIREVNATELQEVDILSDHVYYFAGNDGYKEVM
ncbi:MAG: DUF5688 family protein [Lachnospiraceae bacterium]|nr:DUF5688 family protein [Lachnospiraceae bacterium]